MQVDKLQEWAAAFREEEASFNEFATGLLEPVEPRSRTWDHIQGFLGGRASGGDAAW